MLGKSKVIFETNTVDNGGAFSLQILLAIKFKKVSSVSFYNYEALRSDGAGYFNSNSKVVFEGNIAVRFNSNRALDGGAILAESHFKVVIRENSISFFYNNLATTGGGATKVLKN